MITHVTTMGIRAGVIAVAAWGSGVLGGGVFAMSLPQSSTNFILTFGDIVALATFITGPPTMLTLLAWRHMYKLVSQFDERLDQHILSER